MVKCAHCLSRGAKLNWNLRPCALSKRLKAKLCAPCDAALNGFVLSFFNVRGGQKALRKYRKEQSQ